MFRLDALLFIGAVGFGWPSPAQEMARPTFASDPTWNWRDQKMQRIYYRTPVGQATDLVRLPFDTPDNRLCGVPPDMEIEDGWMLVHRDFGSEEIASPFPYFTLYNKYRGTFRIMLYNPITRDDSVYLGELFFMDADKDGRAAPLFTFSNPVHCSLKDYEPGQREACFAVMKTYGDWAVFDYTLAGYDPKLFEKDPVLVFRLTGIASSAIHLDGKGDLRLIQESIVREGTPSFSMGYSELKLAGVVQSFIGGTNKASEWEPLRYQPTRNADDEVTVIKKVNFSAFDRFDQDE